MSVFWFGSKTNPDSMTNQAWTNEFVTPRAMNGLVIGFQWVLLRRYLYIVHSLN